MFHADDLKEYAELRNAIVHFGPPPKAIAEPHMETVLAIEQLRNLFLQPPKVVDHFKSRVQVCSPDEPIGDVIKRMRSGRYSQMPVLGKGKILGLLTTNTVVRWLAAQVGETTQKLEREVVATVLYEAENSDNYDILSRSATVFDALRAFERHLTSGPPLDALLITATGVSQAAPVAILTLWDYPRLVAMARGERAKGLKA